MYFSDHLSSRVLLRETFESRERIKNRTAQTINVFQTIFGRYRDMLSLFSHFNTVNNSTAVKFTHSVKILICFVDVPRVFSILVHFASCLSKGFRL